jgi:hypothetical protein
VCRFLSLLSGDADDECQWKSRLLSARFRTGAHHKRRVVEGLHLLGKVNALNRRVKHFHKHDISFEAPSASHICNL